MTNRRLLALLASGMLVLLLGSVLSASAASNTVPVTRIGQHAASITANTLKPPECSNVSVTTVLAGSGEFNGTTSSELIVTGSGNDKINAREGDDCILAGAGDDHLIGGPGTDVCNGGTGTNTFDSSCETTLNICSNPGRQTVIANADTTILEASPTANRGTTASLDVESAALANTRALIGFALPPRPPDCTVASATLRVWNRQPDSSRTIEARRVTAAWTETGVTWTTQPATTDPASASTPPSSAGWQTWTVTTQVDAMYTSGNHGLMLRDQTESALPSRKQSYHSREYVTGGSSVAPELVIEWR